MLCNVSAIWKDLHDRIAVAAKNVKKQHHGHIGRGNVMQDRVEGVVIKFPIREPDPSPIRRCSCS